ncbi:phosphatidylglycerophosphatase A [bacterium]|nr:phosphatidylglycerophosphatase A [bacterium]
MRRVVLLAGSVLGTGFFPVAPATFTTAVLAALLLLWAPGPLALALLLAAALLAAVPVATRMERLLGHDPKPCTIDELVGFLIALQGTALAAPGAWRLVGAAFLLFRGFDILKVWPGRRLERWPAGWGIVADDVMAGLYSLLVLRLIAPWLS